MTSTRTLQAIDADEFTAECARRGVADWPLETLAREAVSIVARPKHDPADSFVLHAPLELMARLLLLPHVDQGAESDARMRIARLAVDYDNQGVGIGLPVGSTAVDDPLAAASRLAVALEHGDLDETDRLAASLAANVPASEVQRLLAGPVMASLGAAAHGSILLNLLPRVGVEGAATLLRGPAREIARYPDWRLSWFEHPDLDRSPRDLYDALADVPLLGLPGSDFIFPIMNQAEESGTAPKLLGGLLDGRTDRVAVTRTLTRVAAWSMLGEPPDHAPYGWTHCLTLPQAVMGIATPPNATHAAAIAATHVVGFRSAMAQRDLDVTPPRAPRESVAIAEAIDTSRALAASVAWHASPEERPAINTELASRAARHPDAHLAKYTLACRDAMAADPSHTRLYLAASASLAAWWADRDQATGS